MTENRTDIHRESRLVPSDYRCVFSYNLASTMEGLPIPSFGVNCELDKRHKNPETGETVNGTHSPDLECCIIGLNKKGVKWASHGTTGKCTACGTNFIYGDVWQHIPTGEYIHLGHICADKVGLLTDRSAYEIERDRIRRATLTQLKKNRNAVIRQKFLDDHPGLEEALETDHYIVNDIKNRFVQWLSLSDAQINLVHKIAKEVSEHEPEEPKVPARIVDGRQLIEGTILTIKGYENDYGYVEKVLIKIKEEDGYWLTWGTLPSAIRDADRGDTIRFTAKLQQGDDIHFSRFIRPTKAAIVNP